MPRHNDIPLFHFGVPLNQGKAKFERNDSRVRCPLLKLRDLLNSSSMMDPETLKNLLPSLFQVQNVGSAGKTRRKATGSSSGLENNPKHTVRIDITKLDAISSLSSGEKERIKKILSLIQCDSESHRGVTTKVKPKKKKARTFKRVASSHAKENLAIPWDPVAASKDLSNFRAAISKARGHQKCPDRKGKSQLRVSRSRATVKSPRVKVNGLNASSQDKLLQALINLNPDGYGDTLTSQMENATQQNQINITNFKVKYVSPTYVVQYNGEDKPQELPRERFYSNVALESHLGRRPALSVQDDRKDRQSMHYEDSMPYIVGMGVVTEQMLRERSGTLEDRENSLEGRKAISARAPWQRESIPGYLKPPLPDSPAPAAPPPPQEPSNATPTTAKSSWCQRLLGFVRRVLCMSGGEETTEAGKPQERKEEEVKVKRKVTILDDVEVETPCVRTTKSEFFRGRPKN